MEKERDAQMPRSTKQRSRSAKQEMSVFSAKSIGDVIQKGAKSVTEMGADMSDSISRVGRSIVNVASGHGVGFKRNISTPQMMVGGFGVFVALVIMALTFLLPCNKLSRKNRVNAHCTAQIILVLSAALVIRGGSRSRSVTESIIGLILFMLLPIGISVGFYYFLNRKQPVSEQELSCISTSPAFTAFFAIYLLYFVDGDK